MEIGLTTRQGLMTEINLRDGTTEFKCRLMQHEAELLVLSILMVLAEQDSFRWTAPHDQVRDVMRYGI